MVSMPIVSAVESIKEARPGSCVRSSVAGGLADGRSTKDASRGGEFPVHGCHEFGK